MEKVPLVAPDLEKVVNSWWSDLPALIRVFVWMEMERRFSEGEKSHFVLRDEELE